MIKESEALKALLVFVSYCQDNTCKIYSDDKISYCPLEWFCMNEFQPWLFSPEDIKEQLVDAQIREEEEDGKMQLKCKECTQEKCIAREQAEIPEGFWLVGCLKKDGCMPNPLIAAPENAESPIILVYGEYEVKK